MVLPDHRPRSVPEGKSDSGFNYTGASWDYPLEIDELLPHDASLPATAPDADPNFFLAGGQSVPRTGWTHTDPGQRYLLFHGVAVADNHNHADQLSFILEAEGQMMCSDSGYSRRTYADAERTDWYATAAAHNTLTSDGTPADTTPTNVTPPSTFRVEQPGLVGEEKRPSSVTAPPGTAPSSGSRAIITRSTTAWRQRKPGRSAASFTAGAAGSKSTELVAPGAVRPIVRSRRPAPHLDRRTRRDAQVRHGELTYIKGDFAEFPYVETASNRMATPWIALRKPAAAGAALFTVEDRSTATHTALVVTSTQGKALIGALFDKAYVHFVHLWQLTTPGSSGSPARRPTSG